MKKLLVVISLLFLTVTTNSWASFVDYNTETMNAGSSLLVGTDDWSSAKLIWDVNQGTGSDSGKWQYIYTFTGASNGNKKRATLIDIETITGFKIADPNKNLLSWSATPTMTDPTLVTLPAGPSGLQWVLSSAGTSISLTLVTNTKPMWGDVYVGGQTTNFAKNSGYGSDNPSKCNQCYWQRQIQRKIFCSCPHTHPRSCMAIRNRLDRIGGYQEKAKIDENLENGVLLVGLGGLIDSLNEKK